MTECPNSQVPLPLTTLSASNVVFNDETMLYVARKKLDNSSGFFHWQVNINEDGTMLTIYAS
jgi:hypothetical protein